MNLRNITASLGLLLCAAAICAVLIQRQKLSQLRAEQRPSSSAQETVLPKLAAPDPVNADGGSTVSPELLQLRSKITRLEARQRELAGVPAESERLRGQLAAARTNAGAAAFIRLSRAQMVGYSTPENTLQSFLWALQNRNLTNLFQALTPGSVQRLQEQLQRPGMTADSFFQGSHDIPGLAIRGKQTLPDGTIELDVGVTPEDTGQKIKFQLIAGQWKLDGPF